MGDCGRSVTGIGRYGRPRDGDRAVRQACRSLTGPVPLSGAICYCNGRCDGGGEFHAGISGKSAVRGLGGDGVGLEDRSGGIIGCC